MRTLPGSFPPRIAVPIVLVITAVATTIAAAQRRFGERGDRGTGRANEPASPESQAASRRWQSSS